nr:reverse transcriptase domain-containing protein [Tanacetum cinerariifolium]
DPFPEGPGKVKFLIVVMDYFTKWIKAKAVATITGSQSNGLVERANRSFREGIKAHLGEGNKNWVEELPHVLWAHRIMIKSSHGDTPFSLTSGTEAIIPAEIGMPMYCTAAVDIVYNDEELQLNLDLLEERRECAAIRETKAKLKMTKYYNARVRGVTFRLGTLPEDEKEARKIRLKARQYELMEGILYKRSFLTPWLRCVGPLQVEYAMKEIHEGSCSMHAGPRSVVAKAIRLGYFWPTMHKDAHDMIRKCSDCQIHRPVTRHSQQPLTPITAPWPFYKWGIDIAGPFSEGPGKVKFLIVAMDHFTKWIEAKAVATITGGQVKKFVWDNIVCRFGIPGEIISDNGKQFADNTFKDWCDKLNITQHFASVKHPQSNGLVKRANQSLGEGIKARIGEGNKNWVEELPHVLWAHRTMIKSSHGDTPFSLTYGTEAVILAEIGMPTYRTTAVDVVNNDDELRLNLDLLEERRELATMNEARSKSKMMKYYNSRVRGVVFQPGDFVYRSNDASHAVVGGKLGPKWEGPYEVTDALGNGAYKLRSTDGTVLPRTGKDHGFSGRQGAVKVSHFEINCRVLNKVPTLSLFCVFYIPSFNSGVDERVFPTVVDWRTSALKDEMPSENTYSPEAVMVLNTHRTPIQKQPKALLCLVGLSCRYYLRDEVISKRNCDNGRQKLANSKNFEYTPTLPSGKSTILSPGPGSSRWRSSDMPYSDINSSRYSWEIVDIAVSSFTVSLPIFNKFYKIVLCTNLAWRSSVEVSNVGGCRCVNGASCVEGYGKPKGYLAYKKDAINNNSGSQTSSLGTGKEY